MPPLASLSSLRTPWLLLPQLLRMPLQPLLLPLLVGLSPVAQLLCQALQRSLDLLLWELSPLPARLCRQQQEALLQRTPPLAQQRLLMVSACAPSTLCERWAPPSFLPPFLWLPLTAQPFPLEEAFLFSFFSSFLSSHPCCPCVKSSSS